MTGRPVVIGLDPGTDRSSWCGLAADGSPAGWGTLPNADAVRELGLLGIVHADSVLCVEMIASYGMPVGREVFETCVFIGRCMQAWEAIGGRTERLTRLQVKNHLCHSSRATDANIRARLIDLYGPGKPAAIGVKKKPGPLYGMKADEWAALAVAFVWWSENSRKEKITA